MWKNIIDTYVKQERVDFDQIGFRMKDPVCCLKGNNTLILMAYRRFSVCLKALNLSASECQVSLSPLMTKPTK